MPHMEVPTRAADQAGCPASRFVESRRLLGRHRTARAALRILGNCPLSVPELAYLLRQRVSAASVRRAVLLLRLAGRVAWTGRWLRLRGGGVARVWGPAQRGEKHG